MSANNGFETKIECTAYIVGVSRCLCQSCRNRNSTCARCGVVSGDVERHYDRRGIYISRVCPKCWREVRKGFRKGVL